MSRGGRLATLAAVLAAALLCAAWGPAFAGPGDESAPAEAVASTPSAVDGAGAVPGPPASTSSDDAELSDDNMDFLKDEAPPPPPPPDPLERFNRAVFAFNDKVYFWVLKPVAQGYSKVVPAPARKGVRNFFSNLAFPVRFVNCLLQGKGSAAEGEFARFLGNTTVGCLGFMDVGERWPKLAAPDPEDTGQTLGKWGIGNGFYLVIPFLGPSSARDACGAAVDRLVLSPTAQLDSWALQGGITAYEEVNETSLSIGDYETLKSGALDPYTAARDAYFQFRRARLSK